MDQIVCSNCGCVQAAQRKICSECFWPLSIERESSVLPVFDDGLDKARHFARNVAELFLYLPNYSGDIKIDIPAFLTYLKSAVPDLPDSTIPEGLVNLNLPQIDLSGVDLPAVDPSFLADFLANMDMPDVDLAALGSIVEGIDLSGFASMLEGIDLSAFASMVEGVDLSIIGDLLEGIDIN